MTGSLTVYLLTALSLDGTGEVTNRNVGATFSLHEAELHRGDGVANDYETFQIDSKWQEDAATTELVIAMRGFRDIVQQMQEEALR
jgi:hypothetical protein